MDTGFIFLICGMLLIFTIAIPLVQKHTIKQKIVKLANHTLEITPQEFFRIRNTSLGGRGHRHISSQYDFEGVYILFNHDKNMHYVGQSKSVFTRINAHLTGHGNGDVYADYKYGDHFSIKTISLKDSGFHTLNELERRTIQAYDAYAKGYNKTRGNYT